MSTVLDYRDSIATKEGRRDVERALVSLAVSLDASPRSGRSIWPAARWRCPVIGPRRLRPPSTATPRGPAAYSP